MPDSKKIEEVQPAKRVDPTPSAPPLPPPAAPKASAAASGDPVVQKLLAERQAHSMELDLLSTATREADYHEEQLKAIDQQLAELGFE